MKYYVKREFHPPLIAQTGWLKMGPCVAGELPVEGKEVDDSIKQEGYRMWRMDGGYFVFKGDNQYVFYKLPTEE